MAALTLLAMALALGFHLLARGGDVGFRLNADDGYIHAEIAEHLARTGFLGFNPGERGGGTSSLPWTLLLALLARAGCPRTAPPGACRFSSGLCPSGPGSTCVPPSFRRAAPGGRRASGWSRRGT